MATIRNRFYPLHSYSEQDVLSLYSTLNTGLAGTLVKISTGTANPQVADGWSNNAVGASIGGTVSYRYETKFKVLPTASGDTRNDVVGLTEVSTLEFDENQQPLRYNEKRAKEIGAVVSGETVPIITRAQIIGIWGQYIDTSMGNVQPGNLAVVSRSGNGLIAAVDPRGANFGTGSSSFIYTRDHVVGKFLTSLPTAANTGIANEFSAQGGYALMSFSVQA